tara:strand:- start:198 stop:965 length:768 start_codon:yes stop_codon:yes gene_type:complete
MPKHRNAGGPFLIFEPGIGITGSLEVAGAIKLNGQDVGAGGGGSSISANSGQVSVSCLTVSGSGPTEGTDRRGNFIEFIAGGVNPQNIGGITQGGLYLGHPSGSNFDQGIHFYNKGDGTAPDLTTKGKPGSRVSIFGPSDGVDPDKTSNGGRTYAIRLPDGPPQEGQVLQQGSSGLIWAFLSIGMVVLGSGSTAINAGEHNGCYPSGLCHTVSPPGKGYAYHKFGSAFNGEPIPMNIGGLTYVIGNDAGLSIVNS